MSSEFTGFSSIIGERIYTYHGTRELDDIFDNRAFDFPKPSDLILELVRQGSPNKNDIVLDFFAGSGTTAHAVQKPNKEDGGNRRFILVSSTEAVEEKIPLTPLFQRGGQNHPLTRLFQRGEWQ